MLRSLPEWNGGKIAWIRGSPPFELNEENIRFRNPLSAKIPRFLLGVLGYSIEQSPYDSQNSQVFISRHNNAYIFSGYKPDTTVELSFKFPEGAPIFFNYDTVIKEGTSSYCLSKAFHEECRIFVKQFSGKIKCRRTLRHEFTEDEVEITGLENAEVTFYPPEIKLEKVQVSPRYKIEVCRDSKFIKIKSAEGNILISW